MKYSMASWGVRALLVCAASGEACSGSAGVDASASDAGLDANAGDTATLVRDGAAGMDARDAGAIERDANVVTGGDASACPATQTLCSGLCADLANDRSNCGACGASCASGRVCVAGVCSLSCPAGEIACGPACVSTATDRANCGACGHACANGQVCSNGSCALSCGAPLATCGVDATDGGTDGAAGTSVPYCADTRTDRTNCGSCGHACATGQLCRGGLCANDCFPGQLACNGRCRDVQSDPLACGTCENACAGGANAVAVCVAGACALRCNAGYGDCNASAADGCETRLNTADACGGCGVVCRANHAAANCTGGACVTGACVAGFTDCNHMAADGCEIETQSDRANCGACGHACDAGTYCSSGECVATCRVAPGITACAGGCRDTNNDPTACGNCTNVCPSGDHSTAYCAASRCGLRCNDDYGDCDGDPTNGCETRLNSTENCGGCGIACVFPNAAGVCFEHTCRFTSCNLGFGECDNNFVDGCETPVNTVAHCGGCLTACTETQSCLGGTCVPMCPIGTVNCGGTCRDTTSDRAACGGCGTACSDESHATGYCAASACHLACATGYADCNGGSDDGCEVRFASDSANCGGCGLACPAGANETAACVNARCGEPSCTPGFEDCNGDPSDGCETSGRCR